MLRGSPSQRVARHLDVGEAHAGPLDLADCQEQPDYLAPLGFLRRDLQGQPEQQRVPLAPQALLVR